MLHFLTMSMNATSVTGNDSNEINVANFDNSHDSNVSDWVWLINDKWILEILVNALNLEKHFLNSNWQLHITGDGWYYLIFQYFTCSFLVFICIKLNACKVKFDQRQKRSFQLINPIWREGVKNMQGIGLYKSIYIKIF